MDKLNEVDRIVLDMVCAGFQNKEIGPRIGKTEFDVQYYRQRIVRKLGAENFFNAVFLYTKHICTNEQ